MYTFKLDPRLEKDCYILGKLEGQYLLLMNNSLVPWFILVPESDVTELYLLDESEQLLLQKNLHRVSDFIKENYTFDKLNVASIGNIVSQLHLHIVARSDTDYCWPDVVWGRSEKTIYTASEVAAVKQCLNESFPIIFTPD